MADIVINPSSAAETTRGMRNIVFTTVDIGYAFYLDGNGNFSYCKTTDGGATWGAGVDISTSTTIRAFDVWFDQWTPGDAGTLIHTWFINNTSNDAEYRTLDTSGDTLGTMRTAFAGASVVASYYTFITGTKTVSGYLYCAYDLDNGAEKGIVRSTDGGTTWSASLGAFVEATLDHCMLYPAANTGDNNDCWAVYQDASANALTLKMWDSSAGSATESATILALTEDSTADSGLGGQFGFSATVRHSDGHLLLAAISERNVSTSDHRVFDINGTASITELTAITTNIANHYHPAIFIEQTSGVICVAYNGKRDGSETLDTATKVYYVTSTDDGASWSAGDTAYMQGTATDVRAVRAPLMGPRFYPTWLWLSGGVNWKLDGNYANSLTTFNTQTINVGQASETDAAQTITLPAPTTVAVAQASETDTAQAITKVLGAVTITVNQATETDLAQSIAVYATATIALGQATEIDLAQIILEAGAAQTIAVGQAVETDAAQVIASPSPITVAVGQASEIELALAITLYDTLVGTLGQASETDLARAITVVFGLTETFSINLKHPTTGLALTGLGNTVVKFEAYQESTLDYFNSATGALQAAQPTPLALLEDVSGNHNGRYAAAATIGVFNAWMVLHIYWDYDASDGRGSIRRHAWSRVYYNAGVELLAGMTAAQDTALLAVPSAAQIATAVVDKVIP